MRAWLRYRWRALREGLAPARRVRIADGDMLPAMLPARNLILVEDEAEPWSIGMRCPCGCGETVELPLSPDLEPRWDLTIDRKKRPSLSPSVWRKTGCRSHYWLSKGRVRWCR